MWCHYLLILFFLIHSDTKQAGLDDSVERRNCTKKNVEVLEGRILHLSSNVGAFERCHFIFEEECCYGEPRDCKDFETLKSRNASRCLKDNEYEVKKDSEEDRNCTLVIRNFTQTAAGIYRSVSNHNDNLQECLVGRAEPVVEEQTGLSAVIGAICAVIGVLVLGGATMRQFWRNKKAGETHFTSNFCWTHRMLT